VATVAAGKLIESSRGAWLRSHVASIDSVWDDGQVALIQWNGAMSWTDWDASANARPPEPKAYWAEFPHALRHPAGGGRVVSQGVRVPPGNIVEGPIPPELLEFAEPVALFDWRRRLPSPDQIEAEACALEESGISAKAASAGPAALSSVRLATIRISDGRGVAALNVNAGSVRAPTRWSQWPARIAGYGLLPVAVVFDVVTSPAQFLAWVAFYDPATGKAPFGIGSDNAGIGRDFN
jgi:hypothetical protein